MVTLALLDPGDRVLLVRPFYCSHQCAIQLAGGTLAECGWDPLTLLPDMEQLRREVERGVKMVVITSPGEMKAKMRGTSLFTLFVHSWIRPGNPTGAVCPYETMVKIAHLCRDNNSWLVVDEAYEHFLHDGERQGRAVGHTRRVSPPCANDLGCPNGIIHLFSMSKSFGLAGWRVGYAVYPSWASEEMVKVQDTLPMHACMASQKVALAALQG
ncbi:unnamed protein product, partial [Hapterophycus canaliculatus]